jgi:hypothetical protein
MASSKQKQTAALRSSLLDGGAGLSEFIEADTRAAIESRLGDRLSFTMQQLAEVGGPSVPTQYRWMDAGLLPFVWAGGRRRIVRSVVLRTLLQGAGRLGDTLAAK